MIRVAGEAAAHDRTFVITPNRSLSWRGLVIAYAVIAGATVLVGVVFYTLGLPLVLPFSGLELLVLAWVFYQTAHQGNRREVIVVGGDTITVESGRHAPVSRREFNRHWAKIVLERPCNWYPCRLMIRSHGRQAEIGCFLNEQERQGLAKMLSAEMRHNELIHNLVTGQAGSS